MVGNGVQSIPGTPEGGSVGSALASFGEPGTEDVVEIPLPTRGDFDHFLTTISLYIAENLYETSTTESGPLYGEVWLIKVTGLRVLLAKGFARAGTTRAKHAVVCGIGELSFDHASKLVLNLYNASGAAVEWRFAYTYDRAPIGTLVGETWVDLSSVKSAIYAYRNIFKQTNVAGGSVVVDFTPGEGDAFSVLGALGANSGTNTLFIDRVDEDNNVSVRFVSVASSAAANATVPRAMSDTGSTLAADSSVPPIIQGNDKLSIHQNGAGAQNDTLTIDVRLLCDGRPPVRSVSRSTNPTDVDGIGVTDGTEGTPSLGRFL